MEKENKQNAISEEIEIIKIENTDSTTDGVIFDDKSKSKKKKPKKVYKKTTFKHKMKVMGVLTLLGMFTGCGLGVWYFNTALQSPDYASLNVADYIGNVDDSFATIGVTKGSNWVADAKNKGLTPADIAVADNILLCEYNAMQATSYSMIGTGAVYCMGTSQSVYSARKFDGNAYTFESLSKGILTVATCDHMVEGGTTVTTYQGTDLTDTGATWITPETVSTNEFQETVGVLPNSLSPYIISEKTIEEASEISYNDETGTYSFTVSLKTIESVLFYYKQVKRSGGLEASPEFYSIQITFTINADWEFVSTDIVETYKAVKFGLPVTCEGTLLTNYVFDGEVTLPIA
ncbi:MAG: hypothetical protein E7379_04350 [Clostridiales bacterium]|nr:hypothetical protein [Clostridiales bacterium]